MQQRLTKKLEEITDFVRTSADRILESTQELSQNTQQLEHESSFRVRRVLHGHAP